MKRSDLIIKMFMLLIVSIVIGTVLMLGVYSIPNRTIKAHLEESTSLFTQDENKVENWIGSLRYGIIDNSTDSTMLNISLCREYDSVIDNALLNPRYEVDKDLAEKLGSSDLTLFLNNQNGKTINYPRYWHGYLLYLIPGLLITNVGGLKEILMCVEFLLAMLLLYKLSKIDPIYMLAYGVTLLFINPVTVALNFQNADIYLLTIIFSLVILFFNDWLKKNNRYYLLFVLFGILTVYIDFLTYPLVTLGVSLITLCIVNDFDFKESIKDTVICSLCWAFGYIGMWFGKWAVASILTNTNVIEDAINSVLLRSSNVDNTGNSVSFFETLSIFKESIHDTPVVILGFISLVIIFIYMFVNKYKLVVNKETLLNLLPYLLIFTIPYMWVFVVRNHFATHQFLEYRTMAISVLAKLVIIIRLFKKNHEQN